MTTLAAMVGAWVLAQPVGAPVAHQQPGERAAALGGPAVAAAAGDTLVERDFAGRVRRLDVPPEEAAAAMLDLDEPTRGRVRAVLAERGRFLEALVADNVDLLVQLNTAAGTGDRLDQFVLGMRLLEQLGPLRESGTLASQIGPLLPPDQAARFDRLVREYWRHLVAEGVAPGEGERADPLGVVLGENFRIFGEEIGRAFQRAIQSGDLIVRVVLAGIDLTPEQRERIDRIVFDFKARPPEGDAEKRYAQIAVAVLAHLTPEQQKKALARLKAL